MRKDLVVLCAEDSPTSYLAYLKKIEVQHILAGKGHIDLQKALEELNRRYGIQVLRVDSGGVLNGILLRAGLVNEVSVLIDATLVGGKTPRSIFVAPDLPASERAIPLSLTHMERLKENLVWLRYEVGKN